MSSYSDDEHSHNNEKRSRSSSRSPSVNRYREGSPSYNDLDSKMKSDEEKSLHENKGSDYEAENGRSPINGDRANSRSVSRSYSRERTNKRKRSHSRSRSRSPLRSRSRSSSRSRRYRRRSRTRSRSRRRSRSRGRRSRSPRRRRRSRSITPIDGARLHVAEIDVEVRKRDLEKLFEKYGRIKEIWMARNPPCFAFVVFERQKDADKALRDADGTLLHHSRIKVTQARPRVRGGGRYRGGYDPNLRCYQCGELGHFSRNCTDTKFGYKRPSTPPRGGSRSRDRVSSRRRSRSRSRTRRSRS